MTIRVCDVCYFKDKKLRKSTWKWWVKDGRGGRITVHLCVEHKDFFKGMSFEAARTKLMELERGPLPIGG